VDDKLISELIRQLHGTLEGGSAITKKDRALLKQLSSDLQALLSEPGATTRARHESLASGLLATITRFEASHPDLAMTMTQVSKVLADMGI
jgi:hypothetical protein